MNSETAQAEAKDWLGIFLGTDARDVTPTVSVIWSNVDGEGIDEEAFYKMAPRIAQVLIAGGSLDEFPQVVQNDVHYVLLHCVRQIETSLLEKYKDELDDEAVAEAYDEFIGMVTSAFKQLIAPLEVRR